MKSWVVLFILLILHVLFCLLLFYFMRKKRFKVSVHLFPLALFLPFWGWIAVLAAEILTRQGRAGSNQIQLEELRIRADSYRSIYLEDGGEEKSLVPLEEAILINDTSLRRQLMLDILRQDPSRYVELLRQARLGDDVEVTHYASTAMMEIQREYELDLQKNEKYLQDHPHDMRALRSCIDVLKEYIGSGMLEESALFIQRVRYGVLLREWIELVPGEMEAYLEVAKNEIELGNFDEAEKQIENILQNWPDEEQGWVIKLKFCHQTENGRLFCETVEAMRSRKIYLSPPTRELLEFWKHPEGNQNESEI